jgi:ADP-ribose pyrophosphatase
MSKIKKWNVHNEHLVVRYPIFSLHEMESSSAIQPSKKGSFVYLDCPNWVNVIAITPDQRIVFVEQYRHGIREITLEIPGGLCDGAEEAIETGVRELAEETGFVGEEAELIGVVQPNPAYQNNLCSTIVVRNARRIQKQELDEHEEIRVCTHTFAEVDNFIQRGKIRNAMVVSAFYFFALLQKKSSL